MELYIEKYSELSDIELWVNQRDLNQNLVDSIVHNQIEYAKKYGEYTFPGTLVIVYFGGKKYIIDGQHRFKALTILYQRYKVDIDIATQFYECLYKHQVDELYSMLNHINTDNCMVLEGKINPIGDKLRQIKIWLKETYGYVIWSDIKTVAPNVNTKFLDEELTRSEWFSAKSVSEITQRIYERNDNYLSVLKTKDRTKYDIALKNGGFCLQYQEAKARWVGKLF